MHINGITCLKWSATAIYYFAITKQIELRSVNWAFIFCGYPVFKSGFGVGHCTGVIVLVTALQEDAARPLVGAVIASHLLMTIVYLNHHIPMGKLPSFIYYQSFLVVFIFSQWYAIVDGPLEIFRWQSFQNIDLFFDSGLIWLFVSFPWNLDMSDMKAAAGAKYYLPDFCKP